jgi:macrolide-specific efflux system membrane fusion protein
MSPGNPLAPLFKPKPVRFLLRGRDAGGRRRRWITIGVAVVVVVTGLYYLLRKPAKKEEFKDYKVAKGEMMIRITAAGGVIPQNRIELKPPLAGRIEQILVREGDYIKKGQILAWISSSDRAALLDAARAKGPEEAAKWEGVYKPTPIVAPLSGFIIARRAEPGQTIGSGDPPLVMADRLIVRAQVDETDMGKIKIGQKADITLDAYPENRIPGRLDHLAYESRVVNNVTVYDIEIELLKVSPLFRSGMTATASVIVNERKNVVLVPAEALTERNGTVSVLLRRKGAAPIPTPVTMGLSDGAMVEVKSGLKEGETIKISTMAMPPSTLGNATNPLGIGGRGGGRH